MTITLIIPEVPRSPNGPKGLLRMHWRARSKYNRDWICLVRSAFVFNRCLAKGRKRVLIQQTRKQLLDPDNLAASCKPILDALRHWELIVDDSPAWIELEVEQYRGREPQTEITIGEAA